MKRDSISFFIERDSDPSHQKYAEQFIRLLGHRTSPWILERAHPNYGSYSGMYHLTRCAHCDMLFDVKIYHDSADVNAADGLMIYWRKHEYSGENDADLVTRINKTAKMMRQHRTQVICPRLTVLL
jgi:hypothetical protein